MVQSSRGVIMLICAKYVDKDSEGGYSIYSACVLDCFIRLMMVMVYVNSVVCQAGRVSEVSTPVCVTNCVCVCRCVSASHCVLSSNHEALLCISVSNSFPAHQHSFWHPLCSCCHTHTHVCREEDIHAHTEKGRRSHEQPHRHKTHAKSNKREHSRRDTHTRPHVLPISVRLSDEHLDRKEEMMASHSP